MSVLLLTLTVAAAIGSGIVGGVLFAFSSFVMNAMNRLAPAQSILAMQAINKEAPNVWFMTVLFGTALTCIALAIAAIITSGTPVTTYQIVGSGLYLAAVVITMGYHVPHNNALATIDPTKVDAKHHWAMYASGWTAWNHARTIAAVAGAATLTIGLRVA